MYHHHHQDRFRANRDRHITTPPPRHPATAHSAKPRIHGYMCTRSFLPINIPINQLHHLYRDAPIRILNVVITNLRDGGAEALRWHMPDSSRP